MTESLNLLFAELGRRSLLNASDGGSGVPAPAEAMLAAVPPMEAASAPEVQEAWASLAVLTQLILLATALIIGRVLAVRRIEWLSEAGVALLLGVAVGAVARASSISSTYLSWLSFKKEFFFIALLPSIIFEAGFSLQVKPFFRNIGAICTFAFVGTVISTVVIGCSLWLAGLMRMCLRLTLVESLMYGSIVSATDPVTVLAVFQRLGANSDLYALVFGESVLNDAVCIVLYRTLKLFMGKPVTGQALLSGFLSFWSIFIGSMFIGVAVGFLVSLALKSRLLRSKETALESCLCILFAFTSYMVADGLQLSGIVAILFCGMVMAHYARPNLSRAARDRTLAFFRILATLSETFVFIYIGASLAREDQAWDSGFTWSLIALLLLAIAVSRAANVALCSRAVNYLRPAELRIPEQHKFMMWWSGLRGAIAFALSLEASEDLADDGKGRVLLTTSLLIVLVTVLVNGGAAAYLLERLNLRNEPEARVPGSLPSSRALSLTNLTRPSDYEGEDSGQESEQLLGSGGVRRLTTAASEEGGSEAGDGAPLAGGAHLAEPEGQELSAVATRFLKQKLASSVRKVREANRQGLFTQLEAFDNRYLQKFFVGEEDENDAEDEYEATRFASTDVEVAGGSLPHDKAPQGIPQGATLPQGSHRGASDPHVAPCDWPTQSASSPPEIDPWGSRNQSRGGLTEGPAAPQNSDPKQNAGLASRIRTGLLPLGRLGMHASAGSFPSGVAEGNFPETRSERPNSIEWVVHDVGVQGRRDSPRGNTGNVTQGGRDSHGGDTGDVAQGGRDGYGGDSLRGNIGSVTQRVRDGYGDGSPRGDTGNVTQGVAESEGFESPGGGSLALEHPRSDGGASPDDSVRSDQWVDLAQERNSAHPAGEGTDRP